MNVIPAERVFECMQESKKIGDSGICSHTPKTGMTNMNVIPAERVFECMQESKKVGSIIENYIKPKKRRS